MTKDYYKTLGVEKSASKDEIKKAFRKLAGQYHPDKKTGDETKFKEVSEAYAVLGNEKKRAEYDAVGQGFAGGGQGGFGGFDFSGFQQGGGFSFDMNDIFENFGDMFGGYGGQRQKRGRDIGIEINLSFKDAIFGITKELTVTKKSICEACSGSGAEKGTKLRTCDTCNGQGKVREVRNTLMGQVATERVCATCHGVGTVPETKCKTCKGEGVRMKEEKISIDVPAGVQNGERLRITGAGEALAHGQAGDLYITLLVTPDTDIVRNGQNLVSTLKVKMTDALLGATYTVRTLDGDIKIQVPAGVQHGEKLRLKGKGVPTGRGATRGDFLATVQISTPTKLSKKAKQLVEDLRQEGV